VPINGTFAIGGFAFSDGGVLTDPTVPITDVHARIESGSLGFGRSFSFFGKTAQAFAVVPYSFAQVSGVALGDLKNVDRAGWSDMRLRVSVLLRGAPAGSVLDIAKAPRRNILGVSLSVVAPTGQFFPERLVNLGTNRWAFKPEFAVSHPMGQRWLLDAYAAVWLFGSNGSFYPGDSVRTQEPMGAFQGHLSYSFGRQLWAALDATYYVGGQSTIDGVASDDRQNNTRLGGTFVFPVGRRHSVKIGVSRGAIVRFGANFTTVAVGWQTGWVPAGKPAK
jgi:hypothetical protein